MIKALRTLKIYMVFTVLSIITIACCETYYRIVGVGTMTAYNIETDTTTDKNTIGIITGAFNIEVYNELHVIASNYKVMPGVYATTCAENYDNQLIESSLKIHTNKTFLFDGLTVENSVNLIELADFDYEIQYGAIVVRFNDAYMDRMVFSDEIYDFSYKINTSDGLELENTISLKFEI